MPYLSPHFDPDVFVSYSHGDPRGDGGSPLKDWTQALIRRLEKEIIALDTDFDDLKLWIDREADPTAHLTEQIRATANGSGVLLIVMSKRYLQSSWCRDELDWFQKQIQDRAADSGRVFILRAQPTDESQWPGFLRDERGHSMLGFTFYGPDGYPLGWPDLKFVTDDYEKEFRQLQTKLIRRLRELRDRASHRLETKAAAVEHAASPPSLGGRRIYLHAPPECEPLRAEIDRALDDEGIKPVTAHAGAGNDLASWEREARLRRQVARSCEALALLRVEVSERSDNDFLQIGVDERERIAADRGAPLPCAVLDKTGESLPFDGFDIERFDVRRDSWRCDFRHWLDAARAQQAAAAS